MTEARASFDLQGHRGARGLRPENTLAAFAHALSLGVTTLELDTAVTRDGVVVVSHDSRLNPDITRDAAGRWLIERGPAIFSLSYAELERFDVGRLCPGSAYEKRFKEQLAVDGERIPRLADLFALVSRGGNDWVRFNIETKLDPRTPKNAPDAESFTKALVSEIRKAAMETRTTIQSFDWSTLRLTKEIAPEIGRVCLTTQSAGDDNLHLNGRAPSPWLGGLDARNFAGSVPRLVQAAGAAVWSPDRLDLNPEAIDEAHGLGLLVIPWTVNDQDEMARLIELGVDGLISDRPDLLRDVLLEKGRRVSQPTPVASSPIIPAS